MNSMRLMAQKGSEDGAKGQYQQDEYTNEYCARKCPSSDLLLLMLLMNHFHYHRKKFAAAAVCSIFYEFVNRDDRKTETNY